jgi:hypothetical protein
VDSLEISAIEAEDAIKTLRYESDENKRIAAEQRQLTQSREAALGGVFLNAGAIIFVAWEALRSTPPSAEELERAHMRSCSWPTENGAAFAESHAEPIGVKRNR